MDRETLIRAILECNFAGFNSDIIDIAVKRIMECTEAEPVRHGRWVKITQEWVDDAEYLCSCCGRKIKAPFTLNPAWMFPYCHCGAKMDG